MFGKGRRTKLLKNLDDDPISCYHVKSVLMYVVPLSHKIPLLLSTTRSFQPCDVYGPRARSRAPMSPRYSNLLNAEACISDKSTMGLESLVIGAIHIRYRPADSDFTDREPPSRRSFWDGV